MKFIKRIFRLVCINNRDPDIPIVSGCGQVIGKINVSFPGKKKLVTGFEWRHRSNFEIATGRIFVLNSDGNSIAKQIREL